MNNFVYFVLDLIAVYRDDTIRTVPGRFIRLASASDPLSTTASPIQIEID
jgi:hypothetical protein